ncbi:hypothetical protein P3602_24375 [Vibrio parahaemolyticus]|uniref:hypothetical protein n=1 Tax=Vibrio TaxID=662 RepID=UPI001CDCD5B4|nr:MULTISPECIES: hypothetical protein [Vibrio]MCA2422221.1 hypothetical protein [Vibrio alginolyticus]MCA2446860.1 hypothetical protein [Vibrio alginolyticus]MCR9821609.1 hypothetical protein [Vibrio parahaemolyticus]MDF5109054.1 hypothetical protein [Vibrio parahaemolyticus]MDF5143959.1 hypothetical protein [Vibrio parahaemolyticus]
MNAQQILANAPENAVYWSPVVGQYFDRQFIISGRQFEGSLIQVGQEYRDELVALSSLTDDMLPENDTASVEVSLNEDRQGLVQVEINNINFGVFATLDADKYAWFPKRTEQLSGDMIVAIGKALTNWNVCKAQQEV